MAEKAGKKASKAASGDGLESSFQARGQGADFAIRVPPGRIVPRFVAASDQTVRRYIASPFGGSRSA